MSNIKVVGSQEVGPNFISPFSKGAIVQETGQIETWAELVEQFEGLSPDIIEAEALVSPDKCTDDRKNYKRCLGRSGVTILGQDGGFCRMASYERDKFDYSKAGPLYKIASEAIKEVIPGLEQLFIRPSSDPLPEEVELGSQEVQWSPYEKPGPRVTREGIIYETLLAEKEVNQVDPFHTLDTFVYPECYSQKELLLMLGGSHRIIVIEGPEKAGKTHLIRGCFSEYARQNPGKKAILLSGQQFKKWYHDASTFGKNGSMFMNLGEGGVTTLKEFFKSMDGIFIDGAGQIAEGSSNALKNWLQEEWQGKTVAISGVSANELLFTDDGKLKVPEDSAIKHLPLPVLSQKQEVVDKTLKLFSAVPIELAGEYDESVSDIKASLETFLNPEKKGKKEPRRVPSGKVFSAQAFVNSLVDKIKLLQEHRENVRSQMMINWEDPEKPVEGYYSPATTIKKCFEEAWKMALISKPDPPAENKSKFNGGTKKPKQNRAGSGQSGNRSISSKKEMLSLGDVTRHRIEELRP